MGRCRVGRARLGKAQQGVLRRKSKGAGGSACVVQGAEFLDQQFAGNQFQLEIEGALHENLYGFLRGHGILLPWEWLFASSQCRLLISSAGLRKNLIRENGRTGRSAEGKSGPVRGCILTS